MSELEGTPIEDIVTGIQTRLYNLSKHNDNIIRVNPDGIYGKVTADSVRSFQHFYGLPESGRVDYITFTELVNVDREVSSATSPPAALNPFARELSRDSAEAGQLFDLVHIIQIMLNTISVGYSLPSIETDGKYGSETVAAVASFQRINRIPPTGVVDRATWNRLSQVYDKYVNAE